MIFCYEVQRSLDYQGSNTDTAHGHFFASDYSVGVQTPKVPTFSTVKFFFLQ